MLFFRLLARALRWRAAASLAVFIVAVIAVLAAVMGPIYLAAANQVVLTDNLHAVPRDELDLRVARSSLALGQPYDLTREVRSVAAVASRTRWFGSGVVAQSAQVAFVDHRRVHLEARLGTVDNFCDHLRFTSGKCPTDLGEAAISARSAKFGRFHLGDTVATFTTADNYPVRLKITGIYEPVDRAGTYWSAWTFFDKRPALYQGQVPHLDTFFVSSSAMEGYSARIGIDTVADVRLLVDQVKVADEDAVRQTVAAAAKRAAGFTQGGSFTTTDGTLAASDAVSATSQVGARLDSIDHEISLTRTLVNLATLQLALLVICVLYALVSATASAHGNEVALAKLRGRRSPAVLAQGLLEPVVLVILAAPGGAALAWLLVREVAPHILGPSASVGFPPSALLITALTALAAVVAASLAARRIITAPVAALLRRGNETETSRVWLFVADAVALAIALAGLVQLSLGGVLTAGKPNPLSALAPTLLAVAVAVVGLRLLPLGARVVMAATKESRRLVPFLAVRQILRRANSARLALLVAVALALATLAVSTWSVSGTNRDIRAMNQAGAYRVLMVSSPKHGDLMTAVDRADPGGDNAMAVEILPVNNTQLIAMQADRMPGIAAWRPDYSTTGLDQIVKTLDPKLPPSLTVTGHTLHVDLTVVHATPGVPLTASLLIIQPSHRQDAVDLGTLRRGRHTYTAQLPPECAQGCRVANFALATRGLYQAPFDPRKPQYKPSAQLELTSIAGDKPGGPSAAAYFSNASRWRQSAAGGSLLIDRNEAGLRLDAAADVGTTTWPVMEPTDLPLHVPVVVGASTARLYPGQGIHDIGVLGLDGGAVSVDGKVVSTILPRLGRSGTIADLGLIQREMTNTEAPGVEHEVWLSSHAPGDIEQRLEQQGLHVTGTDSRAAHRAVLDRSGPAYADAVFLLAALAATVLAIGGAVLAALVTARRRSYELAALEAVGVRPRTLRRASAAEQGLLIGLGVLFGVAAGIGGSAMALPSTPIFVDPEDGPPIEYGLPWVTLIVLIAAVVVALAVVCVIMARAIEGQATASRLRETA